MAMEKLYELHDRGGFDLIVVDTPPTRHALDFLDAPRRLTRLLDNRVFRMLMVPTRGVVRVGGVAAQAFLRAISRVVGSEAVDDVVAFFRAFEGMEDGFRERATQVMALLASDDTAFVLVTSPRRDAVEEAEYVATRLADGEFAVDALVVNRVHQHYCDRDPAALRDQARALVARRSDAANRLAEHYANLADLEEVAVRERAELTGLEQRIGDASVSHVPELGHDVHDFAALRAVGNHLMGDD
jgi:anion-transporting  ArsA/GET3 family ATPase